MIHELFRNIRHAVHSEFKARRRTLAASRYGGNQKLMQAVLDGKANYARDTANEAWRKIVPHPTHR